MPEQSFETLGQYLRREREMRGVSLSEITEGTKVKLAFLQEIEEGRHDRLPSSIYVQGFLRSYARFIGLAEGEVLQRYKEAAAHAATEQQANGARPAAAEPRREEATRGEGTSGLIDQILRPADDSRMKDRRQDLIVSGIFGVREGRNRVRRRSMVIGSMLGAAAAVLLGTYLLVQLFATPKETVIAYRENMARSLAPEPSKPVHNSGRSLSATSAELDTLPSEKMVTAPPPPAPEPPLLSKPIPPPLPTPPPAPVVAAIPPPVPHHELVIEATEKSWLQVEIDEGATKEFLLTAGDRVELRAEHGFDLTIGNAGGVVLTLDGKKHAPLGEHGVVVRDLKLP
jgi:cytoskeletal protein RodZ